MKRCLLTLAGIVSLLAASGCCCDGCNWCNPCSSPCGSPCASPCGGSSYAAPAGAYYTPYGAPVTAAVVPVESLPTY